jgi:serine protease Do
MDDFSRPTAAASPAGSDARAETDPPLSPPDKGLRRTWLLIVVVILVATPYLLPKLVYQVQYSLTRAREEAERDAADETLDRINLSDLARVMRAVPKKVRPSVVHINTTKVVNARELSGDEGQFFFGPPRQHATRGQGSGVVVDAEGYVITNLHVISGASEINVKLSDGRTVQATTVGADPLTDLAVLKIDSDGLTALEWGDSDDLAVGDMVWAAGSPFGLDHSITFGILSAKGRRGVGHSPLQNFLQTDTAVNPGNSGGPLVNSQGKLVGINTLIIGETYQGISFAVPSNVVRHVYDQIRENQGMIERGWLGVALDELTPETAKRLGLQKAEGVLVLRVIKSSPAQAAGIQPGDVIRSWNGETIRRASDLSVAVAQTKVSSTVTVIVIRGGETLTLDVHVGKRPDVLSR